MCDSRESLTDQEAAFLISCRELRAQNPDAFAVMFQCLLRSAAGDEAAVEDFRAFVAAKAVEVTPDARTKVAS